MTTWEDREPSPAMAPRLGGSLAPWWGIKYHTHYPTPCQPLYLHPLCRRGQNRERVGRKETRSDNKPSVATDLKKHVVNPRRYKGSSRNTRNVCPEAATYPAPCLQGGLPFEAGLWPQASSLTSYHHGASHSRLTESSPAGGEATVSGVEGCAP